MDEERHESEKAVHISKSYLDIKHRAVYERFVNDIASLLNDAGDAIPLEAKFRGDDTIVRTAYHLGGGITAVLHHANSFMDRRYRGHVYVEFAHDKVAAEQTTRQTQEYTRRIDEFYAAAQQLAKHVA